MLPPKRNRFCHTLVAIFVIFNLLACAGYPSAPREPQTADDTYEATEDEMLIVPVEEGILANDNPREGNKIILETMGEMETQNGGTVDLAEDGSFTYVPDTNFSGNDQLVYKIRNSKGKTGEATIFFEVAPVNDPPEPQDDQIETGVNEPVTINVLANDSDPDGDDVTVQSVEIPNEFPGIVQNNGDGTLTYTPQTNHSGSVSFDYTISDGNGAENQARVYITVGGNTGLVDDTITVEEGQSITFPTSQLLANDENGAQLTVIGIGEAQNGTAVLEGNRVTYTPTPDYSGPDSFTYTVETVDGLTASATVNVTVTPVHDPPTISDIPDQVITQGQSTGALMFTVSDPDTNIADLEVIYRVVNADPENLLTDPNPDEEPNIGVTLNYSGILPVGTIRVTPNPALFGTATIRVIVSDPEGNRAADNFVLTVNSNTPNQPPTISDIPDQQISQGSSTLPIQFNYGDPDPGTTPAELSVNRAVTSSDPAGLIPDNGITLTAAGGVGTIQVTPDAGLSGTATITVTVQDQFGAQASDSFVLTVLGNVNTAPTINPNSVETQSLSTGDVRMINFIVSDQETPAANLNFTAVSSFPTVATVATGGSGILRSVTITAVGYSSTMITVRVTDAGGLSAEVNFLVNVDFGLIGSLSGSTFSSSANLSGAVVSDTTPLAENDIYSTAVGQILTIGVNRGVLANDRDALDRTLRVTTVNTSRLTLNSNGSFTYRPPAGFIGRQSFTYTVTNNSQNADAALTIVVGGNQVPQVTADGYVADAGGTLNITAARGLLANDIDPDGQSLSVVSTGVYDTLFGGEVNIQPNGSFSYISPGNFDGFDSFTYTVSDGHDPAVGIAEISVTP